MKIWTKVGGILYNPGGKLGSNYPDLKPGKALEPGLGTRFRLQITKYNVMHMLDSVT